MKINDILSDEEIENLIDGSSDIAMIRRLIEKTQYKNLIDDEDFADQFSFQIRGFIDAEIGSDAYEKAYINNRDWGFNIATNINELLINKWTKM